jgi:uncharacterized protein
VNQSKAQPARRSSRRRRIWIDLDNSPHVPFFLPIIAELKRKGYEVTITARDAYQVRELVEFYQVPCKIIGRHYGKNKVLKILGACVRAAELLASMIWRRPDIGVSHGSRSQLLACFMLRIPNLTIFDYEFITTTRFVNPTWAMVPEVVPASSITYTNCTVLNYPGIKEDVYLASFRPDPSLRGRLGVSPEELLVMLRPPATEAHYHNPESDVLLEEVLACLKERSEVKTVILPRNERQAAAMRGLCAETIASGKVIIPKHVEDGLNLIWNSDLVISGGGTMNREAAAMRIPVYSIFRGKTGAVDRYLVEEGRLVLLETRADVRKWLTVVRRREELRLSNSGKSVTLNAIVDNIISMAECGRPATVDTAVMTSV